MTEQERQETKARLIKCGFWGADEPGDPTTNDYDAGTLSDRLQAKLSKDAYLVSAPASARSLAREVVIFHDYQAHRLVTADNYPEAISLAALALPEFLRRRPECATDRK
jgi:hypothetical protein